MPFRTTRLLAAAATLTLAGTTALADTLPPPQGVVSLTSVSYTHLTLPTKRIV